MRASARCLLRSCPCPQAALKAGVAPLASAARLDASVVGSFARGERRCWLGARHEASLATTTDLPFFSFFSRHQLEMPGHYSHLEAFYDDKKGVLPDSRGTPTSQQPVHWLPSIHRYMYPEMKVRRVLRGLREGAACRSLVLLHVKQSLRRFAGCFRRDVVTWAVTAGGSLSLLCAGLAPAFRLGICACVPVSPPSGFCPLSLHLQITHPAGCMSQFIKFFGEQILVLWKFALLRKRILIFSPPPVGVVCYRGMFPGTPQSSDLVG